MSRPHDSDPRPERDPEQDPDRDRTSLDAPEDADFAEEHDDDTTVADDPPAALEGVDEPESPSGRGGAGGMDLA